MAQQYFEPSFQHQHQHQHQHFNHHQQMQQLSAHYADAQNYSMAQQQPTTMIAIPTATKTNETKPRLGKDEVEVLEREFKKNPKPTTQTKRQFAEDMGVDLARINVGSPAPATVHLLTQYRTGFRIAEQNGSRRRSKKLMKRGKRKKLREHTRNHRRLISLTAMGTLATAICCRFSNQPPSPADLPRRSLLTTLNIMIRQVRAWSPFIELWLPLGQLRKSMSFTTSLTTIP
jgi:hypothetical protein